tara:strand:+ start:322 stop:465 length:144 start_codon:yes stop_codon:yes gene_type:complete
MAQEMQKLAERNTKEGARWMATQEKAEACEVRGANPSQKRKKRAKKL